MRERVKSIWIPGSVIFLASMGFLRVLIQFGVRPVTFFTDWHHPWQFYLPWLIVLPAIGALGAYCSRLLGGDRRRQFLAGMFPVVVMACFGLFALVTDLLVDVGFGHRHSVWHSLCGFGYFIVCWVVAPGAALFLGTLLILHNREAKSRPVNAETAGGATRGERSLPRVLIRLLNRLSNAVL